MAEVVYPKATGWVSESILLVQGEPWDANDPFVRDNPHHFIETSGTGVRRSGRTVEAATAAPGEKRAARRTSKDTTGDTE